MKSLNPGNIYYIYDAVVQLKQLTKRRIDINSNSKSYDIILRVENIQFTVEAKPELRISNKGIVLAQIKELQNMNKRPVIIIAKYIAGEIAKEFKEKGINYLDIAGNSYINYKDLFIFITGQKAQKISKKKQGRAFQEAGIKLLFHLLKNPEYLQYPYRNLAKVANISIGSVSTVMKELEDLNFLLKTNKKRILKNTPELLNRWIVAYNEVLRPRILKKRMRFSNIEHYKYWDTLPIKDADDVNLWGGEPAAAILTGQLQAEKFIIYTNGYWPGIATDLMLIPDESGDIEILSMFWEEEDKYREQYICPSLLVYADLISSGYDRNIQIAKQILENELQHIK